MPLKTAYGLTVHRQQDNRRKKEEERLMRLLRKYLFVGGLFICAFLGKLSLLSLPALILVNRLLL